ncbi:hypothetical protein C7E20_05860 [Sphingobium sp. AEW4]|nr:hypothetical protein C7E20_05860 [Sphingobium sp. AEW4]
MADLWFQPDLICRFNHLSRKSESMCQGSIDFAIAAEKLFGKADESLTGEGQQLFIWFWSLSHKGSPSRRRVSPARFYI